MRSNWYRGRDGKSRLWLAEEDIENMMDDELRRARLYPTLENPVVEIERFIERHLGARLDQHAELEASVLGQTEFVPGAAPHVRINRNLTGVAIDENWDEKPSLLGRWRATVAHEASHVVIHRVLFELDEVDANLAAESRLRSNCLMRCLKANVLFRGGGSDWREVQANLGMAALLMPRAVFRQIAEQVVRRLAVQPAELVAGSDAVSRLVRDVAAVTCVSRQAATIRLETLGILTIFGESVISGAT